MAFDFNKLAATGAKKAEPATAPAQTPSEAPTIGGSELDALLGLGPQAAHEPLEATPTAPAPVPTSPASPLDAMISASAPSNNVEINKLQLDVTTPQANTLAPLFDQTSLDAMDRPSPLPVTKEALSSPEAVDFLNNVASLQGAIGNPSLVGDSIRYIGEELRSKPHLNAIFGNHPKHMGLVVQAIRKTYNVALGATVKRRTTKQANAKAKAVDHKALDDLMGGADFGDLGSLSSL